MGGRFSGDDRTAVGHSDVGHAAAAGAQVRQDHYIGSHKIFGHVMIRDKTGTKDYPIPVS